MVTVSWVIQWAGFINNADGGFVRGDDDFIDLRNLLHGLHFAAYLGVQLYGAFHRCLCVELGREGDFEQHLFHYIRAIAALEFKGIAFEQHIVKAPGFGR